MEPEMAEEGTFVLPVGADFREFLSHLLYCKCTSPLAQIFMLDATRFRKLLEDNDANTWPGCEEDFKSRDASWTCWRRHSTSGPGTHSSG